MEDEIHFTEYETKFLDGIVETFLSSIQKTCNKDYNSKQIKAWTSNINKKEWDEMFSTHYSLVATYKDNIVGFGDITDDGYLNMLYVHPEFQNKRIATFICDELEKHVDADILVDVSITAKTFFLKRGYQILDEQCVIRKGIKITNFKMIKCRNNNNNHKMIN